MRILLAAFLLLFVAARGYSQENKRDYFIVVGAYAPGKESYAHAFIKQLKKKGVEAQLVADPERPFWLVHIHQYDVRQPAIQEMLAVRERGMFPEAWVRIPKYPVAIVTDPAEAPTVKVSPAPALQPTEITSTQPPALAEVKEPEEPKQPKQPESQVDATTVRSEPVSIVVPESKTVKSPPTLKDTPVLFYLYDGNDNDKIVAGNIEIVDTQRARLIKAVKSADTVLLPNPNSDNGMISLITDVFGYRKVQHEINYKQPVMDSSKRHFDLEGDYFVARFEMVRYHRGDLATMYHVFFFNDAAIMMPESTHELNKLLDMMKSNTHYRIMLHGHTNGNSRGRILSMGPSKEFFSLKAPDVKEGSGSSKELSGQRAEVIRDWLVAQGIAADRMEVKAWGGTRMIHDKDSNNARKNARVEIEVLAE
ncbi:MAG TPA: OmpA family protein [Cyclobacteriaceae bacterium]|nr:OmpA family protein [Cyclobacteriaceae bacterium]